MALLTQQGHKRLGFLQKDLSHAASGSDLSVFQNGNRVAYFADHFHLVRHHYNGQPQFLVDLAQKTQHRLRRLGIQRRSCLVT